MQLGRPIRRMSPAVPARRHMLHATVDDALKNPRHLTAAGQLVKPGRRGRVKVQQWQTRNWTFYDLLGPIHYGLGYKHNAITKMQFFVGKVITRGQDPVRINLSPDEDTPEDELPTPDDLTAVDELDRIEDSVEGGIASIVADASVNLEVCGECYLWGREDPEALDPTDGESWTILSTEELKMRSDGTMLRAAEDGDTEVIGPDDVLIRIYIPHPRNSKLADAPLSSVAFECEELVLLARAMRSSASARLSNGILLIPEEMSFREDDVVGDPDALGADDMLPVPLDDSEQDEGDPFQAELIEAMMTPLQRDGTAADVVPMVWRGRAEYLKEVRHVTFTRDEAADRERRNELLTRIAHGIDMPAEILLGIADMNHWSAWMVDEQTYKQHIDPLVLIILEALTRSFLWPALQAAGIADYRQYRVWRDISGLTAHPNRFTDATRAFDRGAINWKALRREGNFGEADAPTDDELEERRRLGLVRGGSGSNGGESGPADVEPGMPDTQPEEDGEAAARRLSDRIAAAMQRLSLARNTDPKPPLSTHVSAAANVARFQIEGGIRASALADIDVGLMSRVQAAAELAAERVLEKAGARLVTKVRNDEAMRALIRDVPKSHVAATLGPDRVAALQVRGEDLIPSDSYDELGEDVDSWMSDAQDAAAEEVVRLSGEEFERDVTGEDEDRAEAVAFFVGGMLAASLALLFDPDADVFGPEGEGVRFRIDPGLIADAVSIAGGAAGFSAPGATSGTWAAGIGNGQRTLYYLAQVGLRSSGYVWRYGDPSARTRNFEPHRRLNGLEFTSWEDEALSTMGTGASWVGAYFEPRDHRGCLCWVDRVVRQPANPYG